MYKLLPLLLFAAAGFAETRLGKPLTMPAPAQVGDILAKPEAYVAKTVQVKGKVIEVCQMMGCWMAIADLTDSQKMIRIQVNDGDIVFPKDAAGKTAIAEGTLTKKILTREQVIAQARHEAEEQGRKFDSKSVKQGKTVYEIQGTGAIVID